MGSDTFKPPRTKGVARYLPRTRHRLYAVLAAVSIIVLFFIVRWSVASEEDDSREPVHDVLGDHFHNAPLRLYEHMGIIEDEEWRIALATEEIVAVDRSWVWGVSEKYPMVLANGMKAMCKPATARDFNPFYGWWFFFRSLLLSRPPSIYTPDVGIIDANLDDEWVSFKGMRAQGASEIIAFYLDEVLQYHRKPPLSSRLISNKQLYFYGNVPNKRPDSPYQKKDHKWVERTGVKGWVSDVIERYLSPSYPVAVSMHAWARDMKTTAPAHVIGRILLHVESDEASKIKHLAAAMLVSDTIVFDWLMDDHDRKQDHNWISFDGQLLIWDSGLAMRHGPLGAGISGSHGCAEILCGTLRFMEEIDVPTQTGQKNPDFSRTSPKYCNRICMFRKDTVNRLRKLGSRSEGSETLGALMKEALSGDPVGEKLFELNVYRVKRGQKKDEQRRYYADNFFDGFNRKLRLLLSHIDNCVSQYGEEKVIMDIPRSKRSKLVAPKTT